MIKKIILLLSITLILGYCYFYLEWVPSTLPSAPLTSEKLLNHIPLNQRKILEKFFRRIFRDDLFGYVLLGEKPLVIGIGPVLPFSSSPFESTEYFTPSYMVYIKGWYLWQHYQASLPSTNIKFYQETYKSNGKTFLTVANKKRLYEFLNSFSVDFKKCYGNEVTMENFLQAKNSSNEILGTLLGYSQHNAQLYEKRHQRFLREGILDQEAFVPVYSINLGIDYSPPKSRELHNNIASLLCEDLYDLRASFLPGFIADPSHPETTAYLKLYLLSREKQLQIFNNRDFLRTVLDLILAPPPEDSLIEKINSLKPSPESQQSLLQ